MTRIREYGSFVLADFGYDQLGRRTSLTFGNGEQTLYSYDDASRLRTLTHDLGGALTTNDNSVTFTYNPAGQIVRREATNSAYSWNGHGNGTTGSTADGLNRLTAQGGAGFSYDAKGNMIADGARTYSYDSENRLADTSDTIPYHYDPLGRLSGAGAPLVVHYENYIDGLVAERAAGSSSVSNRHVFGPGIDEPIVWYVGSSPNDRRFLHADERGSIVAVTSQNQTLLSINRYDEYGRTQTSGTNYGRFLYTGQRWFGGIDLYYYKNRFYQPSAGGRFLQPDPIGYGGGINLYVYVGGDPVNATDPTGTEMCTGSHINMPEGSCGDGRLGVGLSGSSTAGIGMGGSAGGGKDASNNPSKGSFKNILRGISNNPGKVESKNSLYPEATFDDSVFLGRADFSLAGVTVQPLINPLVYVRPLDLARYHHVAERHFGSAKRASVFSPEYRNIVTLNHLAMSAVANAVPGPGKFPGTLVYIATWNKVVGTDAASKNGPTYIYTVVARDTGQRYNDGRRIMQVWTMHPGAPW